MKNLNGKNIAVRRQGALTLFNCAIVRETEKAVLISGQSNAIGVNNGRFMQGWVPKSALSITETPAEVTLELAKWFNRPCFQFQPDQKPLHKQLQGWDGHSRKGQAIYDQIFEQEMADADKYDPSDRYGHYDHL